MGSWSAKGDGEASILFWGHIMAPEVFMFDGLDMWLMSLPISDAEKELLFLP